MREVRKKGQLVRGYGFYHMQDTEHAVEGGGVDLGYGADEKGEPAAVGIGRGISDALRAYELTVEWDVTMQKRIKVVLDWKRRRSPKCSRSK